jgi:cytochrome c-type biogenesis protein CcmE
MQPLSLYLVPSLVLLAGGLLLQPREVELRGVVLPGSIVRQNGEVDFQLLDCGQVTNVHVTGVTPDSFVDGNRAMVKGTRHGGRVEARLLICKCATKYQYPPPSPNLAFCSKHKAN